MNTIRKSCRLHTVAPVVPVAQFAPIVRLVAIRWMRNGWVHTAGHEYTTTAAARTAAKRYARSGYETQIRRI